MKSTLVSATVASVFLLAIGCGTSDPLWKPSLIKLADAPPDSFQVEMITSAGKVEFRFYRAWSPLGVGRVFYLFDNNFYEGARFYRVIDHFVAQFGDSGDAALDSIWNDLPIRDEPVRKSNRRGIISFARAGAQTRTATLFINLVDNTRLDSLDAGGVIGYPPLGRVISGMNVVDSLYSGYRGAPMRTDLTAITLAKEYPRLDSIASTRVTRMW